MRRPPFLALRRLGAMAATVLALQVPWSAMAAERVEVLNCGEQMRRTVRVVDLSEEPLQLRQPTLERRAATISLTAEPGLAANTDALDAWNRAVAIWEGVLGDNVTIEIVGDLQALDPGVLGSTSSSSYFAGFDLVRGQMVADRAADESYVANLPTAAQFNITIPPGFTFANNVSATKALLKAQGFDMSSFTEPDAQITFSTGFEPDFDYDPSDGIAAGKFDFEAIVVHEIGHALGFTSAVDVADFLRNQSQTTELRPTALDLFRLVPGGSSSFTTASRPITTGDLQATMVFFDGTDELGLSTGVELGDGRQASHWKANELTGTFIGIMDPTLSRGERAELTPADLRAFGVIGWDVSIPAPITDCNNNSIDDADDIAQGTEQDCNQNLVPDSCDIASGNSQDANGDGVPNECESTAVAPSAPRLELAAYPNPFNPQTEIVFSVSRAGRATVDVYDLAGRRVAILYSGDLEVGTQRLVWDGRNDGGQRVASGVYLVQLRSGQETLQRKLALIE